MYKLLLIYVFLLPSLTEPPTHSLPVLQTDTLPAKSATAMYFDSLGLTNIADVDSTIRVDLMYASPHNFTGRVLYDNLKEGYLHPDAAKALAAAQKELRKRKPGYSLIVYDATRPMSVQQKMWNVVKGTAKNIYVSNPARGGGLHNYGLAVDVSLVDPTGKPLPMGTEVDHLGYAAHINAEDALIQKGVITAQQRANRVLLRTVMKHAGFRTLPTEWWHFNFCSRQVAKQKYKLIK